MPPNDSASRRDQNLCTAWSLTCRQSAEEAPGLPVWPLLLAVVGSASNNIGKAMQKKATGELPQLSMERKVIVSYASHQTWRIGLLADVGGAAATLCALSGAPVSLVQPVGGCGMAILAIFSKYYLHEELQPLERVGVAMAAAGTVGVGLTVRRPSRSCPTAEPDLFLACMMAIAFAALEVALQHAARSSSGPAPRLQQKLADTSGLGEVIKAAGQRLSARTTIELVAGVQAGMLFGLSAASARTAMLLAQLLDIAVADTGGRGLERGLLIIRHLHAEPRHEGGPCHGGVHLRGDRHDCDGRHGRDCSPSTRPYRASVTSVGWVLSLACVLAGVAMLVRRAPVSTKLAKDLKEVV